MDSLRGHVILIVESDVARFVAQLQETIESIGAETIVARDTDVAHERCKSFQITAAAINAEHRDLAAGLTVPVVLYGPEATPAEPDRIVSALAEVLSE